MISHYIISLDSSKFERRIIKVALVRFKVSQHSPKRINGLKKYLADAPFVLYCDRRIQEDTTGLPYNAF